MPDEWKNVRSGKRMFRTSLGKAFFCFVGLALLFFLLVLMDFRCPVKALTGLPCPGCGLTRACLSALRFDFAGAFRLHPLFWLGPVLLFLAFWRGGEILPGKWNLVFWGSAGALFAVVYLSRMLLLFPDTPPMDPDLTAPGIRLWNFWFG